MPPLIAKTQRPQNLYQTMAMHYPALILIALLLRLSDAVPAPAAVNQIAEFCSKDKPLTKGQAAIVAHVLEELVAKTPANGFTTSSYGTAGRRVYGLGQCRGDVSTADCSDCIVEASKKLPQICPDQGDARIWYDYCFLRYGTEDFIGKLDTGYAIFYYNVNDINSTEPDKFDKQVGALMNKVSKEAVVPKNRGLGKAKTPFSPFVNIYALVQCNGDLSQLSCAQCLAIALSQLPNFCQHKVGCQAVYSSCKVRYEIYPFFFPLDSEDKGKETYYKKVVNP